MSVKQACESWSCLQNWLCVANIMEEILCEICVLLILKTITIPRLSLLEKVRELNPWGFYEKLDWTGSGYGPVAGSWVDCDKLSGSMTGNILISWVTVNSSKRYCTLELIGQHDSQSQKVG